MAEQKNMVVALLLSFIICGIGNVYIGLTKQGLFELAICIIFNILAMTSSVYFYVVSMIWLIFAIYDTYLCTSAVNKNEEIPKLLGKLDIQ